MIYTCKTSICVSFETV